jgi:Copper binding periplasmic protein CusF
MKQRLSLVLAAMLLVAASAVAADHEKKGKIVRVDPDTRVIVVQGEKGDQWDLYWTETTKFQGGLTATELRPGDKVEFEFIEREGRMWATTIDREKKAD